MNDYGKQLMNYLEVLMKLNDNGFYCRKEIQEVINKLHFLMGFNEEDVLKKLEEQVEEQIKNRKFTNKLIAVTERHRGIGKTTKLAELAKKYNLPILVGFHGTKEYILREIDPSVEVIVINDKTLKELTGRRFPNGVLVDCPMNIKQYTDLLYYTDVNIRGGFFQVDAYFI